LATARPCPPSDDPDQLRHRRRRPQAAYLPSSRRPPRRLGQL